MKKILTKIKDYIKAFVSALIEILKDPEKVKTAIKFLEYILLSIEMNKSKAKKGPKYVYKNIGQGAVEYFEVEE